MTAQQDRIDAAMLESMAMSIRHGLQFSFNSDDMVEILLRASERAKPSLCAITPATTPTTPDSAPPQTRAPRPPRK